MGTILEGELAECLDVVKSCFERMSEDCQRIACSIKIDYRQGADDRLNAKITSVERQLARKLKT